MPAPTTDVRQATLRVAAAGTFLVLVAFTTVVTTVRDSAADLGAGVDAQTWALAGMSLGLAAALLAAGTIADAHGRRRVFVAGSLALTGATVLAAVSWSGEVLVAARVLQGVAGAAVTAASLGLIGHAFPVGPDRTRATGVWGAAVGSGIVVGPLLSGALVEVADWRVAYWVQAVVLVGVAWAARSVPESRAEVRRPVDAVGVLLLGAAMALLCAASVEGRLAWDDSAIVPAVAGALLLLVFGVVERRRAAPALDPALLLEARFATSVIGALTAGVGAIAMMSFTPTFVQRQMGATVLESALVLSCWALPSVAVAWSARRLPARIDARARCIAGTVLVAIGLAGLAGLSPGSTTWRLVPGLLVMGVGSGLVNASLGRLAVESVPPSRVSMGSGANNTARYLGGALGVAVVVTVVSRETGSGGDLAAGFSAAALVCAGLSALGAVAMALGTRRRRPSPADV